MSDKIDPELVERFRRDLERLWGGEGPIGLAVSGGPDSMAMLMLAHAAIPGRFEVATVDHGLRPEAREECALVQRACDERGIACAVLSVDVGKGNVQARAREARYEALADWAADRGLEAVSTAHHADDQAETVVMRMNRGAGVTGLGGIAERRLMRPSADTILLRPVLGFTRAELSRVLEAAGVAACADPSNENTDFQRVRVRRALAEEGWLDPQMVTRSASHLRDADKAVSWASEQVWEDRVRRDGDTLRFAVLGPKAVRLRIIGFAMRHFGATPDGGDEARLLERLERGENANLAGVLVKVDGEDWVFGREPLRGAR
ncbi:tRNA lysidine(34) synthetase TilS [Paraurantiacibacter namhicola]|uniref:tRNA(Ile)-lysidine synthase n=1 Tax=Paraurantiacibacter namhicola TaxID=645517 RepID=A0A1C7DBS9_9SPHN|nr:tRNA lysidine(34) synthetase TilS [Paraurantiacibacter namhicola]ANU08733.1 tRNA(Ile)-lysidine synthase [Paraurantiacibacter namhicola]